MLVAAGQGAFFRDKGDRSLLRGEVAPHSWAPRLARE